jgi:hypothetical protein
LFRPSSYLSQDKYIYWEEFAAFLAEFYVFWRIFGGFQVKNFGKFFTKIWSF